MHLTAIVPRGVSHSVRRRLVGLTGLLAALTVLHDLDHLRQGRSLPAVLYLIAIGALASLSVTLSVLLWLPTWAKPAAAAQGVATVVGVGVVHALPRWSAFSDSYSAAKVDLASWLIVIGMMGVGLALAAVALFSGAERSRATG